MGYSKLTPEQALACKAGLDLDVFVWEYVWDGQPGDMGGQVPPFSRKADAAKMLMIRMFVDHGPFQMLVEHGTRMYRDAVSAGHVYDGPEIPVWYFAALGESGFGRTYEEALCKLAIIIERKRRQAEGR